MNLARIFALLLLCIPAFSQALRFDSVSETTSAQCTVGSLCPILAIPGTAVKVCVAPGCTSTATTYTDSTAAHACPGTAQVTFPASANPTQCVTASDTSGNFGFWALPNILYNYYLTLPASAGGGTFGPYPVTFSTAPGTISSVAGTARQIAVSTSAGIATVSLTPDLLLSGQSANGTDMLSGSRATDSTPTGNFQNFKSFAGASLWQVDVGGILQAGTVPFGRLTINAGNVVGLFSGCAGIDYLGADNNCHVPTGGGATIANTTNLIKGDGSGNGLDSTIVPSNVALKSLTLAQFASTSSAQLFSLLSDPTGSGGSAVFATGPTIAGAHLTGQPFITDFTNAGHTHASVAQGGQLDNTAVKSANQQGNGTKFMMAGTVSGAGNLICTDAGLNATTAGCPSSGGGSPGATIIVTNSATPAFTCPNATSNVFLFKMTSALATSITSSTLVSCPGSSTVSSVLTFVFTQAATGGPYTVAMPTGFSQACQISPIASADTNMSFAWDGSTARLLGCNTTSDGVTAESAAPGVTPPSGYEFGWADSTGLFPRWENSSGIFFQASKELTSGQVRVAGGVNAPDSGVSQSITVNGVTCSLGGSCSPVTANNKIRAIGATFDGAGVALTSGATQTTYFTSPYACTISAWNATVDTGTITIDVWKIATGTAIPTSANTITASALPAISTGTAKHSTTLTGWTTTVSANDIFGFNINAVASATKASIVLECDQ
jgi:hypothetical protein